MQTTVHYRMKPNAEGHRYNSPYRISILNLVVLVYSFRENKFQTHYIKDSSNFLANFMPNFFQQNMKDISSCNLFLFFNIF